MQQYVGVIQTIEEALQYVVRSFQDYSKTEGDTVLSDVFMALGQVAETNLILNDLFTENADIQDKVDSFNEVINHTSKLEGQLDNQNFKEDVVTKELYPAFTSWSQKIQKEINPLLQQ